MIVRFRNFDMKFPALAANGGLRHVIDCDDVPRLDFLDKDDEIGIRRFDHREGGQIVWDKAKAGLLFPPQGERAQKLGKLPLRLARTRFLNANALDFLLEHPELVPDEWKPAAGERHLTSVSFCGTVFHGRDRGVGDDGMFVRELQWYGQGADLRPRGGIQWLGSRGDDEVVGRIAVLREPDFLRTSDPWYRRLGF